MQLFSADPLKLFQVDGDCRWTAIIRSLQRCLIGPVQSLAKSDVLSALDQDFIKDISVLFYVQLSLNLD